PAPRALTACTVNRYVSPLTRPVTSTERWFTPTVSVFGPPSMTYRMMAEPLAGAGPQVTRALASPAEAVTLRGAPGLPTAGVRGGSAGGGGTSAPRISLAYLSTCRARWAS